MGRWGWAEGGKPKWRGRGGLRWSEVVGGGKKGWRRARRAVRRAEEAAEELRARWGNGALCVSERVYSYS